MQYSSIFKFFFLLFLTINHQVLAITSKTSVYPTITINSPETHISGYPEKKLVVIITSYNNKDWYRANLDSVYNQNYSNYRVIYMDDNSPDGTGKLVQAYLKEKEQEHRTTLICHSEWQSQMCNHYNAVYLCDDDEIICHLDGDDYLSSPQTLQIINAIYQDEDVWMTLGLPIKSTTNQLCNDSYPEEIKQKLTASNGFRLNIDGWPYSHLRTFRAWLFKQIKLEDLMFKGNFGNMSPCPDVAMGYPMLEMSGFHNRVVTNRLYVWNEKNPISQRIITSLDKILTVDRTIRFSWPTYTPLIEPVVNYADQFKNQKCDMLIIGQSHEKQLESETRNTIDNIKDIYYIANDAQFDQNLRKAVAQCSCDWIILSDDTNKLTHHMDAAHIILELECTFSYAFHLHRILIPALSDLKGFLANDIIAWQPYYTKHIWSQPENGGTILYRKRDIQTRLDKIASIHGSNFYEKWTQYQLPERTVCLFYRY